MIRLILRWILAAGCFWLSMKFLRTGLQMEKTIQDSLQAIFAAFPIFLSLAALVAGVLLISPEPVSRFCSFLGSCFTNIFFPDDKFSKPVLSYVLARRYTQQHRFPEAVEEYMKIIHYYPSEKDAYQELLAIAYFLSDQRLYHRYYRRFKRLFKDDPVLTPLDDTSS